jgi:hypothetical protein
MKARTLAEHRGDKKPRGEVYFTKVKRPKVYSRKVKHKAQYYVQGGL